MKGAWLTWLPLILFGALAALFIGSLLKPDDHNIASKMVGKPLPEFTLPQAASDRPPLSSLEFKRGRPLFLNFFASWCVPCAAESQQLIAMAKAGAPIEGIAIRDARSDVDDFLKRYGNPYKHIGLDARSSVQIALGSSGVPETFIIDGEGRIIHQHIGYIREDDVPGLLKIWKDAQ